MPRLTLADGRVVGYAQAGPPDGVPVFVLHGAIGSPMRRSAELARVTEALGVRYLMVDRPGFGVSDAQPGRTLTDAAGDLAAVADTLGLERFALVGVSAGGPYALAAASALPAGRVAGVAAVSSPSPACATWASPGMAWRARVAVRAVAARPQAATALGDAAVGVVRRRPGLLLRAMTLGADSADRELLTDAERSAAAVEGFLAATARGVRGLVDDHVLCSRPWGFPLAAVAPEVQLWHGARDTLVPPLHAVHLAAELPRSRLRFDPADGHFFFRRRLHEILAPLAASLRAGRTIA